MPPPITKKRKLNRNLTVRENADNLFASDPYNVELWMHIISRADKQGTHDDQRHVLDLFLSIFPTSARQWKHYIELEMQNNAYCTAQALFRKVSQINVMMLNYTVVIYHYVRKQTKKKK